MGKKRKRRRRLRKFPIIILLLIIAVTVTLTTPTFDIKTIEVSGNEKVLSEEIIIMSGIMKGNNIFTFSKNSAAEGIKRQSYIDTVKIRRKIPKTVAIEVTESTLAAYVDLGSELLGIDKRGKALELFPKNTGMDKPCITGISAAKQEIGKNIETEPKALADAVTAYLAKLEEYGLTEVVSEIRINSLVDMEIITKAGLRVKMGEADELDHKFNYFKAILTKIGEESGGVLDITNTDSVPYRKSED